MVIGQVFAMKMKILSINCANLKGSVQICTQKILHQPHGLKPASLAPIAKLGNFYGFS